MIGPLLFLAVSVLICFSAIRYFSGDWEKRWAGRMQAPLARKIRGDIYVIGRSFRRRRDIRDFRKELGEL